MSGAAEFRLSQPAPDVLALAGSLTFVTAARALEQTRAALLPAVASLDLSGLTETDSAGLAVVIALSRQSRGQGRVIRLRSAPGSLRALAQLCDVEKLLALD